MGVDAQLPPLPAPTDVSSIADTSVYFDDVATDVSRVTEKTSSDFRAQSQTSLLIEYFEGGSNGDQPRSRPSVRVRVTPSSSSRRSKTSNDHIQITETRRSKTPSYSRRISLGAKTREQKSPFASELSYSEASNLSGYRPPVEVEVLQNVSDLSRSDITPRRIPTVSDISSMPPDSMIDEPIIHSPPHLRSELGHDSDSEIDDIEFLKAPTRRRSRSLSRDRITQKATQKVMEKLKEKPSDASRKSRSTSRRKTTKEEALEDTFRNPRRKSGRYSKEDDYISATESSLLSSNINRRSGDSHSIRSGSVLSAASSINNPKLLQTVEDAIRRLILPELSALKEEQKTSKNREKFEKASKDSITSAASRDDLRRKVSKHSSAPDMAKPKVVLSRHGEERDVVSLSNESVRSKSTRKSSRESHDTVRDDGKVRRRSSKEKRHRTRDSSSSSALTAAALRHHDSHSSMGRERRKRRSSHSKSRSHHAASNISEDVDDESYLKQPIPPLPLQSEINPSDLTRDSILTAESERDRDYDRRDSISSKGAETPVHEVIRGSPREIRSPPLRTPPRTPSALRQGLRTEHSNHSVGDLSLHSTKSEKSLKAKATTAAGLAAAAAAVASASSTPRDGDKHDKREKQSSPHQPYSPGRPLSPIQSVASFHDEREDVHNSARSIRSQSSMPSVAKEARRRHSNISIDSLVSSPSTKMARTRKRASGVGLSSSRDEAVSQHGIGTYAHDTPLKKDAEEFFQQNHEENERYRRQLERDGSPEPSSSSQNKHASHVTDDSADLPFIAQTQDLRGITGRAQFVNTPPLAVESVVASLHEPSTVSGTSSRGSRVRDAVAAFSEVSSLHEHQFKDPPAVSIAKSQSRSIQDLSPNKERWQQIKEHAKSVSEKSPPAPLDTPRRTPARSVDEPIKLGASALPLADDPMPEIGYHDDAQSDVTTNPSEIKGPLGGYDYGDRSHWPTDPTPDIKKGSLQSPGLDHDHFTGKSAAAATAAGLAAAAANRIRRGQHDDDDSIRHGKQPSIDEDEYRADPQDIYGVPQEYGQREGVPESPGLFNPDEGYISTAQPGDLTPEPYHDGPARYNTGYDNTSADPFSSPTTKHARHVSGLSHGMSSPLYDGSTGRGIDAIQSKDIVALMDHLTVRDAQRNARDTEILVTLVRSAAEMRNQFEEMKKFISEQDALIMQNTAQHSNILGQKILQGPRPQPLGSPRAPRTVKGSSTDDATEDLPTKRKNVFRRALKGLSMKSNNDLAKIEDMLMQLLTEVEGLKEGQTLQRVAAGLQANSLTSYENLRASGDAGYEPEGHAGTSSTPNHSGYLSNPSSSKPNALHSSYHQAHRISAVPEDDEEEFYDENIDDSRDMDEDRMLTPTQELEKSKTPAKLTKKQSDRAAAAAALEATPPYATGRQHRNSQDEDTPKRKHKSSSSSIWGMPKISRWSKTTASSHTPDNVRKSKDRPYSEGSLSRSDVNVVVYGDDYTLDADDRLRSNLSLADQDTASLREYQPRPPSPLIPEDDDPKYQAHRNSLNLQHPQPRPGPTHRHQSHLESQAVNFHDLQMMTPNSELFFPENKSDIDNKHDQWGSNPSLILGRNQSHDQKNLSPIGSDRPYSARSASDELHQPQAAASSRPQKAQEDTPLVPPKIATDPEHIYADVPGAGYVSPHSYSSGHLAPLAPIEEVRYSLETDGLYTPSPQPTPGIQRKITGPRPMASRSPSTQSAGRQSAGAQSSKDLMGNSGTVVRRKPVSAMNQEERDREFEELESYRSSIISETF